MGLIIVAIVFAAQDKAILALAFGSIGLIDIVTNFIFKPPLELQTSRSNLAQLMILITNWFADLMNINNYLSIKEVSGMTMAEFEEMSNKQNDNTARMLDLIQIYCEPSGEKSNPSSTRSQ